ncbi:expressed protein [Phakopsora pachyrhizi]|uniref:Expressed protein n=1 Tax=Phakopsora pachyrhizi TaxID=170000 RepID=A0AAV0AVU9_PHAPC|nr:expressed protein [Phakopsora pachyrhizi]
MNQSLFYPLFALAFASAALATIHTQCYSYFRNKDNCVNSAADDRVRCSSMKEVPAGISQLFQHKKSKKKSNLHRRYDSVDKSPCVKQLHRSVATTKTKIEEYVYGAAHHPTRLKNSHKRDLNTDLLFLRFIQRKGNPNHTVYAPVIDGCGFDTADENPGCFRIAFTSTTFNELIPTKEENDAGFMENLVWDL